MLTYRNAFIICLILFTIVFVSFLDRFGTSWSVRFIHPHPKFMLEIFDSHENIIPRKKTLKRILFYTGFFGSKPWPMANQIKNYTQKCHCDMDLCEVTYDQGMMRISDAVVFHARDMPDVRPISKLRTPNQLWIYFVMENPFHAAGVEPLDDYFNLSSSYRVSSDVRFPYRFHLPIDPSQAPKLEERNYAKGKTRLIAWGVSNCGHQRDQLAKKLHDFGVTIDNFGNCRHPYINHRPFSRSVKSPYHEYKFVFAAENRLCKDYVTEKYWDHAFKNDANAIPIVLGGSNYSDPRIAIPGSFIDAMSFPSPKKLADYLLLVDKNDTLFNEYFKWKKHWRFYDTGLPQQCTLFLCDMCQKLHNDEWNLRKKPLSTDIGTTKECKAKEDYFNSWVNKV